MNPRPLFLPLALALLLAVAAPARSLLADPLANLSEAQRTELNELLASASQDVAGIRMFEALQSLNQAEAIAPDFHVIYNLRGAVYTKLKDFDRARGYFDRALRLNPEAYEPRFNFHEIDFVTGEYQRALAGFQQILNDFPRIAEQMRDMIRYKIFLCHLKLDQRQQADAVAERFDYLDDSPAYYFSRAATALIDDDEGKAQQWIATASRIYGDETAQLYLDSLQELGLVPSISAAAGQLPPGQTGEIPAPPPLPGVEP